MTRVPHFVAVALGDVVIGHDGDGLTIGLDDLTVFFSNVNDSVILCKDSRFHN